MFDKLYKSMAALAMAGITAIALIAPVSAAEQTDPYGATAPSADWVSLAPGESHLYTFHYDFDEGDENDEANKAVVELEMATEESVSFEVWTADQMQEWANGEDPDPVGVGSKKSNFTGNEDHDTKLLWANQTEASVDFYVLVQNEHNATSYYELEITGQSVSFPTAAAEAMPAADAEAAESEATAAESTDTEATDTEAAESETAAAETTEQTTAAGGTGPDDALRIPSDSAQLEPGETRWYALTYKYDEDRSDNSALVELQMQDIGTIEFEVFTPDNVRSWQNGDEKYEEWSPVGVGSERKEVINPDTEDEEIRVDEDILVWTASGTGKETFYIIVENTTDQPRSYSLQISGPAVSF